MTATFLALETSCDETSAAVFTDQHEILANVVTSQLELHSRFGGVVPEVAARAHLRNLLPVIDQALQNSGKKLSDMDAIAVLNAPGLIGALLTGVSTAKMLALTLEKPLLTANHIEAHIYAARMAAQRDIFPCVGLVVSGGHTALFHCHGPLQFQQIGGTIDDAAGEAFDKVAALLGVGFPGGPAIEREAMDGNSKAFAFPRAFFHEAKLAFSFSGLKTAVLYKIHGNNNPVGDPPPPGKYRQDLAASFQAAVVDVLTHKCRQAMEQYQMKRLAVGGGVSANKCLRQSLQTMTASMSAELFIPPLELCTDNAAMAAIVIEKWNQGDYSSLDVDAYPNVPPSRH